MVIGSDENLTVLREALGPQELGPVGVRWMRASRIEPNEVLRAQPSEVAVRCFIDLSALPRARLYFADRSAQHFLARDIDLARGLDDLGKEELGQVVASSIEVLLDNAASGMDRNHMTSVLTDRPPASAAQPEPGADVSVPSQISSVTFELGAFYSLQAFASDIAVSQGPGAFGTVGAPFRSTRLSLRWSAQLVLPQQLEGPLLGTRLDTTALRIGLGGERDLGERSRVGLWLGGGLDVVYIDPRQGSTQDAELTSPRYSQITLLSAVAEFSVRVSRDVRLTCAFVADSDLRPRHYDVTTPTGVTSVLEPWRVRPGIIVGVATWH